MYAGSVGPRVHHIIDSGTGMNWETVGSWIKDNAGTGAAIVGSLLTGGVPAAAAMGISLIAGATGTDDPKQALAVLQTDPAAVLKLKELYYKNEDSVRVHLAEITRLRLADLQDARVQHKESPGPVIVSLVVVVGFVIALYLVLAGNVKPELENLAYLLVGTLGAGFTQVLNYWLGSSMGSKEKDKAISAASSLRP